MRTSIGTDSQNVSSGDLSKCNELVRATWLLWYIPVVVIGLELLLGPRSDDGGVGGERGVRVRAEAGVRRHQSARREPVQVAATQEEQVEDIDEGNCGTQQKRQ